MNTIESIKILNKYVKRKNQKDCTYVDKCGDMVTTLTYILTKNTNVQGYIMINLNMMLETELGWAKKKIDNNINEIRKTLNYMVQEGIFEFNKDFKNIRPNDTILIKRHNFLFNEINNYSRDLYFNINFKTFEILKDIANKNNIDFFKLFNLYCNIVSRLYVNENSIEYNDIEIINPDFLTIQNDIKLSEVTVQKYMEILNKNNILDYEIIKSNSSDSILQQKVENYLNDLGYGVLREYKSTLKCKNPKSSFQLPYDNEIAIYSKRLIIEANGLQHYQLCKWHEDNAKIHNTTPEQELHYQQLKDRYKRFVAYKNGYEYLEIPYWTDDKDETYKKLINEKIKEILCSEIIKFKGDKI